MTAPGDGSWHGWMRSALTQAAAAGGAGDVPIGAVVLDGSGGLLAVGRNEREARQDPTAHAEIVALRAAAAVTGRWNLTGCTLLVTVEPCAMCAGALVQARVRRVVFGCPEPKSGAAGSLWDLLTDPRMHHRLEVVGGVLADDAAQLLRDFFAARRRRPAVDGSGQGQI